MEDQIKSLSTAESIGLGNFRFPNDHPLVKMRKILGRTMADIACREFVGVIGCDTPESE
jgi:hypothetical protein